MARRHDQAMIRIDDEADWPRRLLIDAKMD